MTSLQIPTGYALHIALNEVDASRYGTRALLNICENDANAYAEIATCQGFSVIEKLYGRQATVAQLYDRMKKFSDEQRPGDYFLLTFSGHGGRIPDRDNDEKSGYDQCWCFYDARVPDDNLFNLWPQFATALRVFIISDSCYSGSMLRSLFGYDPFRQHASSQPVDRTLHRGLNKSPFCAPSIRCRIRLLSGAKEDKLAEGGKVHSLFTRELLRVWQGGSFQGTYDSFYDRLSLALPSTKKPGQMSLGPPLPTFDSGRPFTI